MTPGGIGAVFCLILYAESALCSPVVSARREDKPVSYAPHGRDVKWIKPIILKETTVSATIASRGDDTTVSDPTIHKITEIMQPAFQYKIIYIYNMYIILFLDPSRHLL